MFLRKSRRLKRLIPFHELPEAQRKLFQRLHETTPSLWRETTPPPSPSTQQDLDRDPTEWGPHFFPPSSQNPSDMTDITQDILNQEDEEDDTHDQNNYDDREDEVDESLNTNFNNSSSSIQPSNTRLGLDGRPRSSTPQSQKIFVSNQKAFRLTNDKPQTHSNILRFQAQLNQHDFEQRLEDLIDKDVIKGVVLASKAKLDLISDKVRRSQLDDLKNHFCDPSCTKPLDTEVWNDDTVIKLLLENFPKDDRAYDDKTSFALRMGDIKMLFDFLNPEIENTSIMHVSQLMTEYIPDDSSQPPTVTKSQQKEAVTLLIKRWPQAIQISFNAFCTSHERKNFEVYDFLENFSSWCQDARKTKQQAVSANWIVSASSASSFLKGSKTYSEAAQSSWSAEDAKKRKLDEHSKATNSGTKQQKQHQTVQFSGETKTQCNHCNRVHVSPCPFLPWHKEVNKDATVPFSDSAMGKKLMLGQKYTYLSHIKYADGTLITNVPEGFKCPSIPKHVGSSSSSSSSSSSKNTNSSQGNTLNVNTIDDFVNVLLSKGDLYYVASPTSTSKRLKLNSSFNSIKDRIKFYTTLTSISELTSHDLLSCTISFSLQEESRVRAKGKKDRASSGLSVDALLDSGSLAGNFISTY